MAEPDSFATEDQTKEEGECVSEQEKKEEVLQCQDDTQSEGNNKEENTSQKDTTAANSDERDIDQDKVKEEDVKGTGQDPTPDTEYLTSDANKEETEENVEAPETDTQPENETQQDEVEAPETNTQPKNETQRNEPMEVDKDEPLAHSFSPSWSKLSKDDLVDRIKGMVFGQAIGDALGLATEFMSKTEAKKYYKKKLSYDVIVQDFHRSRWDKSDWTDDTDQMLLILLMIVEGNGAVNQLDFAERLHNWMRQGFPEFGDRGGMGIGATVSNTLRHPSFLQDPAKAAHFVWERSGRYLAANGAIMRTSILGALSFNDISKVTKNTVAIAEVTHADPRCKASCVATTVAIALMLQGKYKLDKKGIVEITREAVEEASKLLELKDQKDEMVTHMNSSLKNLKLDDRNTIGYTFKALGCGFYGLREGGPNDFKKIITEVIMEAGDADSNAAVCGAVLGCKVGYKNLPEDLLQLKHKQWMDQKVDAFLKVTGLVD